MVLDLVPEPQSHVWRETLLSDGRAGTQRGKASLAEQHGADRVCRVRQG